MHTALYASRSCGVVLDGAAGMASASCGMMRRTHARPSPGACHGQTSRTSPIAGAVSTLLSRCELLSVLCTSIAQYVSDILEDVSPNAQAFSVADKPPCPCSSSVMLEPNMLATTAVHPRRPHLGQGAEEAQREDAQLQPKARRTERVGPTATAIRSASSLVSVRAAAESRAAAGLPRAAWARSQRLPQQPEQLAFGIADVLRALVPPQISRLTCSGIQGSRMEIDTAPVM